MLRRAKYKSELPRDQRSLRFRWVLGLCFGMLAVVSTACSTGKPSGTVTLPPTTVPDDTTIPTEQPESLHEGEETITVEPGVDLATMVADAAEGATFVLRPGVYRGQEIEPKDGMSFVGLPGAVMSGAMPLSGFSADGDIWGLDDVIPEGRNHGQCVDRYDGCWFTQDLFMDDVMLWQVTEMDDLEPGSWYWEGDVVYVADDPANRRVELSVTTYAFVGAATDVVIKGIAVEKYATPAQEGAIQSQMPSQGALGSGWMISDVEVSGNHGAGIRAGNDMVIRNAYIHRNGQLGITAAGITNLLVDDSEIAFNNTAGFRWEWEAGGIKTTNSTGVVFRNNSVHNNAGPGLWADIDTVNVLYEDNIVVDNTGPGIFHEISGRAVVRRNTVERNGLEKSSWLWGAGILIAGSSDVEVYDNTVYDNGNGIGGIQQDRGDGRYGPRLLVDLYVHDNTIRLGGGRVGIVEDVGDESVFNDRNNRFEANTYIGKTGRNYTWENRRMDKEGWVAAGQDTQGTWR